MPNFQFENRSVAYTETGYGPALLLIAGLGGQSSFWKGITDRLSEQFQVISFDHPGSGGSAAHDRPITVDNLAELAFAVLDHLGIKQAHVIGQSLGGAIAQTMVRHQPGRINRLVLSATWVAPDCAFERSFRLRREILSGLGLEAYANAQVLSVMGAAQIANQPERATDWEQKTIEASSPTALLARIDALMSFDNTDGAPLITHQTLVIAAEDDQVVPVHMSRRLASMIPSAMCQVVPVGGHFLPMTCPETYLEQVLPFLVDGCAPAPRLSVLLIGCGSIGRHIVATVKDIPQIAIAAVLVRPERVEYYKALLGPEIIVTSNIMQLEGIQLDYAVECAGHEGLRHFGPDVLRRGVDLGVLSAGALVEEHTARSLEVAAQDGGARIEILSGALAGVDALRALGIGTLDTVHLISRKPPAAWRGSAAETVIDLDKCTMPMTLFSGTAQEAALLYPKNANVSAIAALNGLGPDTTNITLIADPNIDQNIHELQACGAYGTITTTLLAAPLPDNPRSSAMAALSAVAALKSRRIGNL